MRIRAAVSERTHSGDTTTVCCGKRSVLYCDHYRQFLPRDQRTLPMQMNVRRNLLMLQRQHDLYESRNTRSGFQMSEIRLHGAKHQGPLGRATVAEYRVQG